MTLVIGSWYGFYPFYYAIEHQLDRKHGLRLKVLEPTNIANLRRSYMRNQVDFVATSMIEFTNAVSLSQAELTPLLITDYSNGGDVIIARKSIADVDALKGEKIAVPYNGIGEYVLSLVFNTPKPADAFQQIPIPETNCDTAFKQGAIDACVTYPPTSTYLLEDTSLHQIYSSSEHPGRIFDMVWGKQHVDQKTRHALREMWFETVLLINKDPVAYHQFAANISSVSAESVTEAMQGIQLINRQQYADLLNEREQLADDLVAVCEIAENKNCQRFASSFGGSE